MGPLCVPGRACPRRSLPGARRGADLLGAFPLLGTMGMPRVTVPSALSRAQSHGYMGQTDNGGQNKGDLEDLWLDFVSRMILD